MKGKVFLHKNTGRPYVVEGLRPIKLNGVWVPDGVVLYKGDAGCYARLREDFERAFEEVPDGMLGGDPNTIR